jgi:beta-galactosidase
LKIIPLIFLSSALIAMGAPVPLQKPAPVPVEKLRLGNPSVLPMTGTWKFQTTAGENAPDGRFIPPLDQYFTASSSQEVNRASAVFSGQNTGHWCAENGNFPQWWQVDFGQPLEVRAVELHFENDAFIYQFTVQGSRDGASWITLADLSTGAKFDGSPLKITPGTCRYLRINFLGAHGDNNESKWAYIQKAKITVLQNGKETTWTPEPNAGQLAKADVFARPDFNDADWTNTPVPANWEIEGFSRPNYNNPDDTVGLYRRWMEIPAGFQGKQVLWHFDGVFDSAEIFVNGIRAGYHESGFTAFDIDVTKAIQPGKNNLFAVRVCKKTSSVDLDTGDYWALGGIYRENHLVALPALHVDDIRIVTPLKTNLSDATLNASVDVHGAAGRKFTLTGRLYSFDGKDAGMPELRQDGQVGADGVAEVKLSREIKSPKLWSAEKPNLYYLVLSLTENGQYVESVQERFGFRQIEIRGGVVLWNGVPIKTQGTCRHEEWAALGHALNEAAWRKDIELMKGANINAVRTSHYNHARRFLELCDEKGLYILDEVPGCWCDPKDPVFKPAWLLRTRETYLRDKNSPCVLAWSIGNENPLGPDNTAAFELMKQLDPTRPAFISQCGPGNLKTLDLDDYHYADLQGVRGIIASGDRKTTPFVITEGPHIFYTTDALSYDYGIKDFWGLALANQWNELWKSDSALGAFIWEWQDQGLADKFPEKDAVDPVAAALAGTKADTGAGAAAKAGDNSATALRGNNNKGIVDGFRNIKPEYWQVKMVYSPVRIEAREVAVTAGQCAIPLRNRYSFTDLSELACHWQALAGNKVLASGTARLACPPRSGATGNLPATPRAETLALKFVHPDGRAVFQARLRMPGAKRPQAPAALPASGPVRMEDRPNQLLVHAGGAVLVIDKQTGLISSWRAQGQNLIESGPILNLGEGRAYHGEHNWNGNMPYLQSKQAPLLKNVSVKTGPGSDGAVLVTISGDVYLAESPDLKGQLIYTLGVHPEALIDVDWKLNWNSADCRLFELGMKILTPSSLDKLSWSREGLWTDYPSESISAAAGTVGSGDLSFRCTKRDAHWAWLSGNQAPGLAAVEAGSPLHVRARQDEGNTVFFLSCAIAPPPDFSTGLLSEYMVVLKKGETVGGAFKLRMVPNGPR